MESKHGLIMENFSCIVCTRVLEFIRFINTGYIPVYEYELVNQFIYPKMVIIVAISFLFHKLVSTKLYITGRFWCVVFLTIEELDIPLLHWLMGLKLGNITSDELGFKSYHDMEWWFLFIYSILWAVFYSHGCYIDWWKLIPTLNDLDSAVLQELMYVELQYILNLLMGFDHYRYNVSFTGVKCETLGPCYSEPCDENNTKSSCTEINNLTDYTCSCKTGRSQLFHVTPRQS